jgi:hypothetical protein
MDTGTTQFMQVKEVVDETTVRFDEGEDTPPEHQTTTINENGEVVGLLPLFNPEQHIMLADAKFIQCYSMPKVASSVEQN